MRRRPKVSNTRPGLSLITILNKDPWCPACETLIRIAWLEGQPIIAHYCEVCNDNRNYAKE